MYGLREMLCFFDKIRSRMRFGRLSRMPMVLLRVEWKGDLVECDWLMREGDPWDADVPARIAEQNVTRQALEDAMNLRDIIFHAFPAVTSAHLRMFRGVTAEQHRLTMSGIMDRFDRDVSNVPSVVMKAKMCGFRFSLSRGVLETILE